MQLDLASLASISAFASQFKQAHPRLDLLLLSAGVMALPERGATADGFEMQARAAAVGTCPRPAAVPLRSRALLLPAEREVRNLLCFAGSQAPPPINLHACISADRHQLLGALVPHAPAAAAHQGARRPRPHHRRLVVRPQGAAPGACTQARGCAAQGAGPLLPPQGAAGSARLPPLAASPCCSPHPPTTHPPRLRCWQMHRGSLDLQDLSWQARPYVPWPAYAASKLANILHAKVCGRPRACALARWSCLEPLGAAALTPLNQAQTHRDPVYPHPTQTPHPPSPRPGAGAPAGGRGGGRAPGLRPLPAPRRGSDRADAPHAGHGPAAPAGLRARLQVGAAGRRHQRVGGGGSTAGGAQRRLPGRLPGARVGRRLRRSGALGVGRRRRVPCVVARCGALSTTHALPCLRPGRQPKQIAEPSAEARDAQLATALWAKTEELLAPALAAAGLSGTPEPAP